jgi:hypothetical protein
LESCQLQEVLKTHSYYRFSGSLFRFPTFGVEVGDSEVGATLQLKNCLFQAMLFDLHAVFLIPERGNLLLENTTFKQLSYSGSLIVDHYYKYIEGVDDSYLSGYQASQPAVLNSLDSTITITDSEFTDFFTFNEKLDYDISSKLRQPAMMFDLEKSQASLRIESSLFQNIMLRYTTFIET